MPARSHAVDLPQSPSPAGPRPPRPVIDSHPTRASDFRNGDLIDHYRLLECIGRGGQALIWSAIHEPHNTVVALKLLELSGVTAFELAALQEQTGLIASLRHPNVLPLKEVGYAGELQYQISPYIASGSLRDLLDTRALSQGEFVRLAAQIANALHYVHQRQIVHRDLKSTNVLVDYNRQAYLADFGLARALSQNTQALHTGRGTPPYSPPEQHAAAKLTPQSDVYSLGILFYEMLTRQLPWRGEKALGIAQLTDPSATLPDPREVNPDLPAQLAPALHTLTAADPAARPRSTVGALMIVLTALGVPLEAAMAESEQAASRTVGVVSPEEADAILRYHRQLWRGERQGKYPLTLTRFCLLDAAYDTNAGGLLLTDPESTAFMLHGALQFGRRDDYWWGRVTDPGRRMDVCARVLKGGDPATIQRVLLRLTDDGELSDAAPELPPSTADSLVGLLDHSDEALSLRLLSLLGRMASAPASWRPAAFSPLDDLKLAQLALSERASADAAARLIGAVRSEAAVEVLASDPDSPRGQHALSVVLETAGSLPNKLHNTIRWRVLGSVLYRQLTNDPARLLRAYALAALGCLIGFGMHVYVTYRLPSFWDAQRLLVSVERGLFLGALFGFGLFLSQTIVRRLTVLPLAQRLALSVGAASPLLALALYSYNVLFLDLRPEGWLIVAGCFVMASGFGGSAGFLRRRWQRVAATAGVTTLALGLSWLAFLATGMHPILFYEFGAPAAQVWVLAAATALPIAWLGNWIDLAGAPAPGRV